MPLACWLVLVLGAGSGVAADKAASPPEPLRGSATWGAGGIHRMVAGRPDPSTGFSLATGFDYGLAQGLLLAKDSTQVQRQILNLAFRPLPELTVGLSASSTNILDANFPNGGAQALGNPTLHLKYARWITSTYGMGGTLEWSVPAVAQGPGLAIDGSAVYANVLGTGRAAPWVEISYNLGYVYDRSGTAFAFPVNAAQHLALGFTDAPHRVLAGVGAATDFAVSDVASLGPILEFTGEVAPGAVFTDNPIRATLGVKAFVSASHALELAVGADVRITGAPRGASPYPGQMPWTLFASATLHAFTPPAPPPPMACVDDAACDTGKLCIEGTCTVGKIVEREVTKLHDTPTPPPRFIVVQGSATDPQGKAVRGTTIVLSTLPGVVLGIDATGAFKSPPLLTADGLMQMTARAPGHRDVKQVVRRDAPESELNLKFSLPVADTPMAPGHFKGTITNAATGQPIPGAKAMVVVPKRALPCDARGNFSADLAEGTYDILITAPGFRTQREKLNVQSADVVILNVEMHPDGTRRSMKAK